MSDQTRAEQPGHDSPWTRTGKSRDRMKNVYLTRWKSLCAVQNTGGFPDTDRTDDDVSVYCSCIHLRPALGKDPTEAAETLRLELYPPWNSPQ